MDKERIDPIFIGTEKRNRQGNTVILTRYLLKRLNEAGIKNPNYQIMLEKDGKYGDRISVIPAEILQEKMSDKDVPAKEKLELVTFAVKGQPIKMHDGRFEIPKGMARAASIGNKMFIVGQGEYFSLFGPDQYDKYCAESTKDLRDFNPE